ncbi:MAG: AMP-binding protein [Planctomycetaceae bacterium]|nr:AMP-binding protein [Planctomycetaceae bacterium]
MELLSAIRRNLLLRPFRTVVIDDVRRWRGIDLMVVSWHIARAIEQSSRAERIGVLLPTSGAFPATAIAAWTLGRTLVPINFLLSRSDLEYVARDAGLDAVVTIGPMLDHIGGSIPGLAEIRLDRMKFKGIPPVRLGNPLQRDDVAVVLYTSGTSGRPKGVMLTGGNIGANVRQAAEWVDFGPSDRILGVLPQFHSFGLTVLTMLPLATGASAVYTARFVPRKLIELAKEHRPTALVAIPSMYNALRLLRDAGKDDLKSLRFAVSGGEPLPEAVYDGFRERFGIEINEGYGLTETAPVTNWCRPHEQRRKCVGRALPGIDQRIVGPDGKLLGPNEDGEVRMKGPNIMKGYLNLPDETAAVFDDAGYFKTGDMGRLDENGFLSITGRIKEMLIIGGENVFPREIEEVLNRHESVKDSAVIGMHDTMRGEVALAFVELKEGASFDEAALKSWCRDHIAGFKVPRDIRLLKELPRNPTGKIMRRKLSADTASQE